MGMNKDIRWQQRYDNYKHSHIYSEDKARKIEVLIRRVYASLFRKLDAEFMGKMNSE